VCVCVCVCVGLDRCRWSAAGAVLSESWCVLILLWSLISFNVSLSRRALVLTWLWVSLDLIFAMFIFHFFYWRLFSFCSVEMKMGGDFVSALWFCLKILNWVFWIEDMGSLVMALFCWMHISIRHDWFYPDVAWKS